MAGLWALSMVGTATAIVQNLSGFPLLRRVCQDPEGSAPYTPLPILTMTVTCIQIGLYGVFTLGWPNCLQLALCNGLGALFWLVNLVVFVRHAQTPWQRARLLAAYAAALAWALGLPLGLYVGSSLPALTQQTTLAVFMQLANFSGFLSPVASLREAWRVGDAQRVPAMLSWVNLVNSAVWTAYGVLLPDPWIWVPNMVGIGLSGAQVAILLLLRARGSAKEQQAVAAAAHLQLREGSLQGAEAGGCAR